MKELLAYMVQNLVEHPDQVSITETQGEETLLELRQDAAMFRLMLFGLEISLDELSLQCLFRISDYLDQHIDDVCTLCGYQDGRA